MSHALVGRVQQFADDAATLGAGVSAIVDGAEYHLITTTRVDTIHVMDKGFH